MRGIDKVAAIEARGFIFGAPVAVALGAGFVPLRKPGKLPFASISEPYALEYGRDELHMHADAIAPGERVLLIDDLIATGGTMEAALRLMRRAGAETVAAAFVVDLPDLGGRARLDSLGLKTMFWWRLRAIDAAGGCRCCARKAADPAQESGSWIFSHRRFRFRPHRGCAAGLSFSAGCRQAIRAAGSNATNTPATNKTRASGLWQFAAGQAPRN